MEVTGRGKKVFLSQLDSHLTCEDPSCPSLLVSGPLSPPPTPPLSTGAINTHTLRGGLISSMKLASKQLTGSNNISILVFTSLT